MSNSKLPVRPSLESLRKQAKKLARDVAAGNRDAIARARAQLEKAKLPLSQRDAQLVVAREYGFPGWKNLVKEVERRLGRGLEWAVSEARRIIHDNHVENLRQLLTEYPTLLSWRADDKDGGLLGIATGSFGDSGDAFREERFTRKACAELLLDAGVVVAPRTCDELIRSRANGLIELFHHRGLLPQSLKFFAALGEVKSIRARLDANADDLPKVNEAFMYACHLQHPTAAALLLDRSIAFDATLGDSIDAGPGRSAFIEYFIANRLDVHDPDPFLPWQAFVERQVERAIENNDLSSFIDTLGRETWTTSKTNVKFQVKIIEDTTASLTDRAAFLQGFLDLDPAVLHSPAMPPNSGVSYDGTSRAFIHAFTYAQANLMPLLLRIWPMPDDLPHAAGSGDFTSVIGWFDAVGKPALGDLTHHFPANDAWIRKNLNWGKPDVQQVLDSALAFAVMNNHFEIADFLLAHGADINTNWSSHEPASILHELVWHKNYEAMQFLIDRGIDMTIQDYRWDATAEGWASYAAKDEDLAQWLRAAQQRREQDFVRK